MSQKISTRQSRQNAVLPMIGNSANEQLDSLLTKVDGQLSKLFEDRNILLAGGGLISNNSASTSISFTVALSLHVNSLVAGGSPSIIDLTSTSRAFSADGRMLYAVINRTAGTASVTADSATLPAQTSANQEVVLIAKRIGTSIYFRNGAVIPAGQSSVFGRAGSVLDSEFQVQDSADQTIKMILDAAGSTGTSTTLASSQTANRVLTLPDSTDTLVGKATTDNLTNKTLQFLRQAVATDSSTTGANTTLGAFTTGIVRLTNASLTSLSGLPAGLSGQRITIENVTGNPVSINNDEATATAANRIYTGTGGNVTMNNNATLILRMTQQLSVGC
jgi:hypothetical protein